MLWLLTVVTVVALLGIGQFIRDIAKVPTAAAPAALSRSARGAGSASASAVSHRLSPKPKADSPPSGPQLTDTSSGLSYAELASPWRAGCPAVLKTPMFSWNAGENAVAGQVTINGSAFDWHGNACSGVLQQQVRYSGAADLETTAMNLVGALDPLYYDPLVHSRAVQDSSAMRVSGHQAWVVKFLISYPDAVGENLGWSSELGALVVVDRGAASAPAVFYVSVPGNLGIQNVTLLLGSLRLSLPQ
jgi:hypothetical protein